LPLSSVEETGTFSGAITGIDTATPVPDVNLSFRQTLDCFSDPVEVYSIPAIFDEVSSSYSYGEITLPVGDYDVVVSIDEVDSEGISLTVTALMTEWDIDLTP
jgi:alpha-D-ribose 1-methylphosphonate 5-triphosphate synthase subunit PhnH